MRSKSVDLEIKEANDSDINSNVNSATQGGSETPSNQTFEGVELLKQ